MRERNGSLSSRADAELVKAVTAPAFVGLNPGSTVPHQRTLHLLLSAFLRLSFLICEVGVLLVHT